MRTGQLWMIAGLLLFLAQAGCQQQGGFAPGPLHLGPDVAPKLPAHDPPTPEAEPLIQSVSTVLNPEGSQRPISLKECLALALENGRVGGTNIRVLAYDPAANYTNIEEALAKFDTRWLTGMTWSSIDEPAGNVFSTVPLGITPTVLPTATGVGSTTAVGLAGTAGVPNLVGVNSIDAASFSSSFQKLLPTGGLANITFRTDYTQVNQPPVTAGTVNPTYRPRVIFGLEQPLLRGAGVALNTSAIVVNRLSFDQERAKFNASVNVLLFSVEQAYWDLYFAYWNLHTIDTALRQAHDAWQMAKQLQEKKLVTVQDLSALELQYQTLRLARMNALGGGGRSVLEAERQLRFVVGLPVEDGCRLIPVDKPSTAPFRPEWTSALHAALDNRPELIQLRQEIQKLQILVKQTSNLRLPDLRALASYDVNGLGNTLDGSGSTGANAFRSLASDHFNDWTLGLSLDIAIGSRAANAQLRRANLQLAARMTQLRDMEKQATFALQQSYRDLLQASEVVRIQGSIRRAATDRYTALYEQFRAGLEGPNFLLLAQQNWTNALAQERSSIFAYNIALAKFELEKGTIQQYDSVSIADGPLPPGAAGRASAHLNEMAKAVVLRERAVAASAPGAPVAGNMQGSPISADTFQGPAAAPASGPIGAEVPPSIPSMNLGQTLSGSPQDGSGAGLGFLPTAPRP